MTVSSASPYASNGEPSRSADFLHLRNIKKSYASGFVAISDLSISLEKGSMLGLLGPSGCGKTTALRMIAGLLPPTAGSIHIDGINVTALPPHRRDIGLVFQSYALFPHMTVAENVAFGLKMRGIDKEQARDRVKKALDMVRMGHLFERKPRELSGGQQQRVALARALVIEPRLLLLDEPLSNLDAKLRDEMRFEIREIQQRLGITTVLVTHDQVEALTMCDQVAVMNAGEIAQIGSPKEIYETPGSLFVSGFVGRSNMIDCEADGDGMVRIGNARFRSSAGTTDIGPSVASIRPHHILLTPNRDTSVVSTAGNRISGEITHVSYIGETLEYVVSTPGMSLRVEAPTSPGVTRHALGAKVLCEWSAEDMRVFKRAAL
jgi:putative spermidine/putrescine transport system ATP-binding protein